MSFEWDEEKRRSNIASHGIDFVRRIISAWRAEKNDREAYYQSIYG
jgi:uncharacterized DUF497 family protein